MVEFAVKFRGEQIGKRFKQRMSGHARLNRIGLVATIQDAADEILERGRSDISGAGNFGSRWTEGLQAEVVDRPNKITLSVTHDVPYFNIHQYGGVIEGKPLLWIPLSFSDAVGTSAKDYGEPLFRVDRKSGGAPLLLSAEDGEPKYSGHESVTIPKRFHVVEIIREVAATIPEKYRARLAAFRLTDT